MPTDGQHTPAQALRLRARRAKTDAARTDRYVAAPCGACRGDDRARGNAKCGTEVALHTGMDRSVLVIDDNPAFARSLQILLEDERPCRVFISSSIALAHAGLGDDKHLDLIISDAAMLRPSELRLLDELRHRRGEASLAIMTAHPDLLSTSLCRDLDVVDVLEKPIDPERLLSLVDRSATRQCVEPFARDSRDDPTPEDPVE